MSGADFAIPAPEPCLGRRDLGITSTLLPAVQQPISPYRPL